MILNDEKSPSLFQVLRALEVTSLEFHLTGSRYFSRFPSSRRTSDVDLFIGDDSLFEGTDGSIRGFLVRLGFKILHRHGYLDSQTVDVYRCGCVDVQIVKDAVLKQEVQGRISQKFPDFSHMTESEQKNIWEMGFSFLSVTTQTEEGTLP